MISYKITGEREIGKINVEAFIKNEFKTITKAIKDDITENLLNERIVTKDIEGAYAKPEALSTQYRNWKIRKGYPINIFRQKEKLIKSVKSKRINDTFYQIFIGGKPDEYAHHVNKFRKFFGVSKNIVEQIEREFKSKKVA